MKAKVLLIWLLSYLLGCFIGYVLPVFGEIYLAFGIIICILSFILFRKPYLFAVIFAFGVLSLSIWNFQLRVTSFIRHNDIASAEMKVLQLRVDDLPQKSLHGDKVKLAIVGGDTDLLDSKMNGYFTSAIGLNYGDIIEAEVKAGKYKPKTQWQMIDRGVIGESGINNFKKIGKDKGLLIYLKSILLSSRQKLNESISSLLPEREAGLASGIILGEKALVSPEMKESLKISGTMHIIALSGYNITVILGAILLFRNKMSRKMSLLLPILLISIFTIMTGGAPSLVRAAIMGSMPIVARFLYRESSNFIAIIFSATMMAVVNPMLPLFDIGFQLSFVAFAGIIYIAPLVAKVLRILGDGISSALSETVGAQIATVPLLSYYFGLVSIVSPLTNFIILGILPACMAMSFATGLLGMVWRPLGLVAAMPTYLMLSFVNWVISWSGSLSWASTTIKIENPWWILLAYLLIFDIWFMFRHVQGKVGPAGPTE